MSDLTPLEAAEKLDKLAMSPWSIAWSEKAEGICVADLIRISASYLRAIAAGEYRQVVHAQYVTDDLGDSSCSECGENYLDCTKKYCPDCGALMDGKDGKS